VDDPALAAAAVLASGEWTAQTGSELEVVETTEKDLLRADRLRATRCVPGASLGRFGGARVACARAEGNGEQPRVERVFELLRLREAAWGTRTMGIPFGSPVFCCYYRADLLKSSAAARRELGRVSKLAKLLATNSPRPLGEGRVRAWSGTIEPLAPGWAGLVLLARLPRDQTPRQLFGPVQSGHDGADGRQPADG